MTITEFLLARIREDEVEADIHAGAEYYVDGAWPEGLAARVLAECAAKRAIIHRYIYERDEPSYTREDADRSGGAEVALEMALYDLAAVYKDHPGYRSEWAL